MAVSPLRRPWLNVAFAAALTSACAAPGPGVIHYDSDACDHCRMTISDPSFAGQLVTATGKVYRFDDPRCLAQFVAAGQVEASGVHSIWLNGHNTPDTPIKAEDAFFVASDRIRAPMNGGLAAFGTASDAQKYSSAIGGRIERWADITSRGRS